MRTWKIVGLLVVVLLVGSVSASLANGAYKPPTDSDGDGLTDVEEVARGTDPCDRDTDDDGLEDGDIDLNGDGLTEDSQGTSPTNADTDGDGTQDGTESGVTTPVADPDGAGPLKGTDTSVFVPDDDPTTTTDPLDDDTDDDGLKDGSASSEDLNDNGRVDAGETAPGKLDTDGDGCQDGTEQGLETPEGDETDPNVFVADADPATTTDPLDDDSDDDALKDCEEDANGNGKVDAGEVDPNNPDTDGDGWDDGDEVRSGTDPLDPDDHPEPIGGIIVPVNRLGLVAPWLGLAALISLAGLTVAVVRRRRD